MQEVDDFGFPWCTEVILHWEPASAQPGSAHPGKAELRRFSRPTLRYASPFVAGLVAMTRPAKDALELAMTILSANGMV